MLLLLWLLYLCFGLISRTLAPLVTPILKDLHLSYSQMGLILGSWQFTYVFVALVSGTIIDRWGVRRALLAGVAIVGLSSALRCFPTGFWTMLGAVALFGAGGSMISIGCPKTISIWFRGESRGTAVGFYLTGARLGGIFALTLTNSLIMPLTGYSWRYTFLSYGLFTFMVASLWWFFARDAELSASKEEAGSFEIFARLLKVKNVQIVLILGLLSLAISHGFSNWLPKILEAKGFSPAYAGFIASLPFAAGIPSLLIIPRLVPVQSRGRFLTLFALLTIVTLILSMSNSGGLQFAGLILFGVIIALYMPILTLILMDTPEVGSRYMGIAGGMFFCIAEIGGFTSPMIMGVLVDLTGTFWSSVFFLSGLGLTMFFLTFSLRTKPL
jgi:CP family cyanate transporter-like MFS transporter